MEKKNAGLFSWLGNCLPINPNKVTSGSKEESKLEKDKIAELLKTNPQALEAFEKAYNAEVLTWDVSFDGDPNAKQAAAAMSHETSENLDVLISKIVDELIDQTSVFKYDGRKIQIEVPAGRLPDSAMVTKDEVSTLPVEIRPEFTGRLMKVDLNPEIPSYVTLLALYKDYKTEKSAAKRQHAYHMFRQGLDMLDVDPVMYEMIDTNPDSMGHWFPALVDAVQCQSYFKVPKTTLIKIPLTLLQMTRLEYMAHTPTTLKIVDDYCYKIFELNENETYFIRTGTTSLKYDFRNVKVSGSKEVHELGEYLLYNHSKGPRMAGPLSQPSIYGMQTTVEWAVREYIEPKESVPQIYFGMPLRTELRVFIDADEKKVIGIAPYWDPKIMKKRFSMDDDFRNPDKIHDYTVYAAYEDTLISKYEKYKDKIWKEVESMLPNLNLTGQWSLDVMINGVNDDGSDDVYLIDMATAQTSALVEYVPKELLKKYEENWLPEIPGDMNYKE